MKSLFHLNKFRILDKTYGKKILTMNKIFCSLTSQRKESTYRHCAHAI